MRKAVADVQTRMSILLECVGTGHCSRFGFPDKEGIFLPVDRDVFVRPFLQRGFGIERVNLTRSAIHEQKDDGLCLGGEVRRPRCRRGF